MQSPSNRPAYQRQPETPQEATLARFTSALNVSTENALKKGNSPLVPSTSGDYLRIYNYDPQREGYMPLQIALRQPANPEDGVGIYDTQTREGFLLRRRTPKEQFAVTYYNNQGQPILLNDQQAAMFITSLGRLYDATGTALDHFQPRSLVDLTARGTRQQVVAANEQFTPGETRRIASIVRITVEPNPNASDPVRRLTNIPDSLIFDPNMKTLTLSLGEETYTLSANGVVTCVDSRRQPLPVTLQRMLHFNTTLGLIRQNEARLRFPDSSSPTDILREIRALDDQLGAAINARAKRS